MTNQPNSDKKEQDRWEAFLDTVFAKSRYIKEIKMDDLTERTLAIYMQKAGYTGLVVGLMATPARLWDVPVVIDEIATSPKIVYQEGAVKRPPKPKKEKVVDTWMDDEV